MHTKMHKLSLKNISETGFFEGYASVFNVIDHQKEFITSGAFKKSISNNDQPLKMLWQHDMQTPIGLWESVQEDSYGLYVKGRLLMDLAKGREAYALLKGGVIDGLSIGFIPVKSSYNEEKKSRCISEINLLEISLVTFAANPKAKVTSVKNNNFYEDDFLKIKKKLALFKDYLANQDFIDAII